MTTIS
ncbi:hypothetical protein VCBJG01_1730, partial [Vibrio cholerae BJG-01]